MLGNNTLLFRQDVDARDVGPDRRSHTAHSNPARHLSLFSYAAPSSTVENFWVGYRCAEWFNSGLLLKAPNEPAQAPNADPELHADPGGTLGDGQWHHLALTAKQKRQWRLTGFQWWYWDEIKYYRGGTLVDTFDHPSKLLQQWDVEPDPAVPANDGSVILGQGHSAHSTLHHQ